MATLVQTWLQFALQQMAAESYLDQVLSGRSVVEVLTNGNNNENVIPVNQFTGATRFVDLTSVPHAEEIAGSPQAFTARYQIVDHHANDSTGFSATLMREIGSNNFTLSFRSTEFESQSNGGDFERDGTLGADGDVTLQGFAFAQLAAMEDYYAKLRQGIRSDGSVDTTLQAFFANEGKVNVTGYSLGGNLATVFTELHSNEVNHTYTFNAVGRGHISGPGANEAERIAGMLQLFTSVLLDPDLGRPIIADSADPVYLAAKARADQQIQSGIPFTPFTSESSLGDAGNIYADPRYLWAKNVARVRYPTTGVLFMPPPGEVGTDSAFSQITQLYGHATDNDVEKVANRGVHGQVTSIFIEDQPDFTLLGGFFGLSGSYGTTHGLTLIVDSLATQDLFQAFAPSLTQPDIEAIFAASSNQSAFGFVGVAGVAEGNSLENALDALGKLFVSNYTPTPFGRQTGDFGSLTFRNKFYENLAAVKNALPNGTVTIVPFVEMGVLGGKPRPLPLITPTQMVAEAQQDTDRGLAFRYALKNLNPFVVFGADYAGLGHASNGALALFDPITGFGELTKQYLADRAAFLEAKIELNLVNNQTSGDTIYYKDFTGQVYEIPTGSILTTDQRFLFGSDNDDPPLVGNSAEDHLYGGGGNDLLDGQGARDYLQGDGGNDILFGGAGIDTLVGGAGNDVLEGGTEGDTLGGGLGDDTLRGGDGLDTYIIRAVDGADTIEDSDGKGVVEFDGQVLGGALRRMGDPANIFHSADGTITLTKEGANLVVTGSGPLTIKNFTNGQLGIRLVDLPNFGQATRTIFDKIDHYVQVGSNPDGTPIYDPIYAPFFDNLNNDTRNTTPIGGLVPAISDVNNLIHALGGNDYILSGAGDDQLYGEDDDDEIYGGLGNDRLFGGGGNDQLLGDNVAVSTDGGNDYLDGGDGNDFVQGGAGRDIVLGEAGNDLLNGDEFAGDNSGAYDDWLDGGSGDDDLQGGAGSDVLIGGADNDFLVGDRTPFQGGIPEAGGNDVLDGGTGNDQLFGLYGDDLLSGGTGKDLVNGQDGSDVLYGGDGNDVLSGDLRIIPTASWGSDENNYSFSTSEYRAAGGDDLLFGEEGNDILIGGEGSDTLRGDIGDDSLFGGYNTGLVSSSDPLYWTLFTAQGTDWIDAGVGNDVVHGGVGVDTLLGEDGNDLLHGGGGDDVLGGGTGDDRLYGDYFIGEFVGNPFLSQITALAGNNRLEGGAGNDELYGGDKADTLIGGEGNDQLFGGNGVDVLLAGDGDDRIIDDDPNTTTVGDNETLDGGAGNDYLESWEGDDVLLGGTGNDTLVSHAGNDQLFGDEGNDRVIWDTTGEGGDHPNTSGASMQILYGGTGDDVYEIKAAGADAMEFANEGTDLVINSADESYTLPDNIENLNSGGSGIGNALDNVISATIAAEGREGNDTLIGPGRLDGGIGDDLLQGASRLYIFSSQPPPPPPGGLFGELEPLPPPIPTNVTNTYVFGVGYGHDTIQEMDPEFNSAYYQNEDTVEFLSGIAPTDISWERRRNDLELSLNSGAARLTIRSFYDLSFNVGGYNVNGFWVPPQGFEVTTFSGFPSYYAHSRVESFTFADGTVWTADHFGAPLLGDFLADTYQFGRGAGNVTVIDFDFWNPNSPEKSVDILDVGPGISPADLSVSIENGVDLVLSIEGTGDRFTMQSFLSSVVVFPPFSSFGYFTQPYQIEQVQYDDGTIWSLGDLYNRISTISGTANADSLSGNNRDNLIQGLQGNDSLYGGGGNDTLDGGTGNDYLEGGTGSDTYFFGRGGGQETLRSEDWTGSDLEVVRLGLDVLPTDVTIRAAGVGDDVIMQINGTSDQLSLNRFLSGPVYQIDQLVFGDGTIWNTATIMANAEGNTLTGTDESDTLRGSDLNDVLSGLDGNDVLIGFGGNDRLIGGTENDDLDGGAGNDTYVFNLGDGVDTVYDSAVSGGGNRIQFGDGIAPSDLSFERIDTWLLIHVGTGADTIRLRNFDPTGVNGTLVVETLHFSDGSTANLANLLASAANHAPTVPNPLADQIVPEDAPFSITVPANTFADEDSGDVLTYSASLADGTALPTWLSFNAATRIFSGTPDDAQVGSLDLSVTATDMSNLTVSDIFTLTVQNVSEAPTANPLVNQMVLEDAPFSITVPASTFVDPDAGDTLTYSATQTDGSALPTWLSFDPTTRTFTGTPDDAQVGTLNLAVKATDGGSLSATSTFALTVQNVNEAPTVANPLADQQATQGTGFTFVVPTTTFADGDPGDSLTYSATLPNGEALPSWLSFNATTRIFSGMPQSGDVGTVDVRVTATDTGALSMADVFTVTIAPSGGTAGNDTLIGTSGNDLLDGLAGDDVLQGLGGNDTLLGGSGNDVLDGGTEADTMTGGTGNDTYVVDNVGDAVTENANEGTDTVQSSITYTLGVNVENLTLTGAAAINGTGNGLNNTLTGSNAANVLTGGAGNDTYYIGAGDTVVEQANQGTDTAVIDQTYALGANVENLTLSGTANVNGSGNSLNNVLIGNSGNNMLDGGTGADTFIGGSGNDTYVVDNTGDVVTESASEGTDTVQSSIAYTLGANVDNLTLTGTTAINGTGNALNNVLLGNSGNNTLNGGAGNDRLDGGAGSDTMLGGTGDDTYVVSQAGDVVNEILNEGIDTVESSNAYALGANLENLTLTGTANLAGTGNTLNNIMLGNSGANAMDGGTGNDTLDGGAGNDTLQGGSGDDTVIGGLGDDVLSAGSGNDILDGGNGIDTLDGGSGDDVLRGGAGNDTVAGGSGADQLSGGTGNDTLNGGSGNDLYNFSRGDGQDAISDADATQGNRDKLLFGMTINPLDLVISRQANDLRLAIHGTTDAVTIANWYTSPTTNRIEDLQAGNGQHLLNTQVDQLIQAMASFSQQSGLTWDQAIAQRPQEVQTVLAASWH